VTVGGRCSAARQLAGCSFQRALARHKERQFASSSAFTEWSGSVWPRLIASEAAGLAQPPARRDGRARLRPAANGIASARPLRIGAKAAPRRPHDRQCKLTNQRPSTYIDGMTNQVALAEAASGPDPAAGLRAARALRELAERLEALQVQNARDRGWSWQDIAIFLGISKQAVHKKYAGALAGRPAQSVGRRLAGRRQTGAEDV
jgi:hypothetical protein